MSTDSINIKEFKITVQKISEENVVKGLNTSTRQLAEEIAEFIEKHLTPDEQIRVRLSLEDLNNCVTQEIEVKKDRALKRTDSMDFSTNYWI